jgi:hypothetical protein
LYARRNSKPEAERNAFNRHDMTFVGAVLPTVISRRDDGVCDARAEPYPDKP